MSGDTDLDLLFKKSVTPLTSGEKYQLEIEENYTRDFKSEEKRQRKEEKTAALLKLKELRLKLKKCKNAKNNKREAVNLKAHEMREKLRRNIEQLEVKLKQLQDEEDGSKINSNTLVNATRSNEIAETKPEVGWSDLASITNL